MVAITTTAFSQSNASCMKKETKDVSCKLTSPELQKRKATVVAELKSLILEKQELSDGFNFKFEGTDQALDKLNEFVKSERQCCDFFSFQITVEDKFAWLKIYGGEGAKEFLQEEIGF
jgi:hypothetical protein